jgi:hypothetical protein
MQRYGNRSGASGVAAYEIGEDSITVKFTSGARYLYTDRSAGHATIVRMQALAREGQGLSTFISQEVREQYARKLN